MRTFEELTRLAGGNSSVQGSLPREECVAATRDYGRRRRNEVRRRHDAGESGANVVHVLSDAADAVLRGVLSFGLTELPSRHTVLSRIALCALGGYGRGELSPHSDIDVCLLYDGHLDDNLKRLNTYVIPFLWDIGFTVGYAIRSVEEAVALAKEDITAFTSFMESRLIMGANTVFARLKLPIREMQAGPFAAAFVQQKAHDRYERLAEEFRDPFAPEPDVKESAGGLRDFHTALWMLMMGYQVKNLDDAVSLALITPEEQLNFAEALDFLWRVRNELHFRAGRKDDRLTFAHQTEVAHAFGYQDDGHANVALFMQDYYAAATTLRHLLHIAARICNYPTSPNAAGGAAEERFAVEHGQLFVGLGDKDWFAHYPPRLMEVFWLCARHKAQLSRATERLVTESLRHVNDAFRTSDLVRRFFLAVCNRPQQAGQALRQAAKTGVLGCYIPEFAAVQGRIRYQDFHHYPVDEHTLRAIEALGALPNVPGPVGRALQEALENLADPYVLVMAILCHDLGKAAGEKHVEESVRLTRRICRRIGMTVEDEERVAFLVEHHLLMNHISQHRDVDDDEILDTLAATVQTDLRLRALFLMSYADLSAVGPNVWNEWKGALLLTLYLRTLKRLLGRVETIGEEFWLTARAEQIRESMPADRRVEVDEHLRGLGQRYFVAFSPKEVARHLDCIQQAKATGLALYCTHDEKTGMSEVVVSTRDHQGLFSQIAGTFCSLLIDVNRAALFTRPDGFVLDCFTVTDAPHRRPLTPAQVTAVERVLRAVLLEGRDIQEYVEKARRRLFALLQPRSPIPTRVRFDNVSSRRHTVIDIETGDRTGLLYDITHAMAECGLDIFTARIATDACRVRDAFYVTRNGERITDERGMAAIEEALREAILQQPAVKTAKGDTV